ncbi:MAG: glycosyltransferase [Thermodesulfobacteriota bacterium]
MNFLPKVSIIVPVFNAEHTIKECIDSILSQNYPREKLELIFVNNSSTDNTQTLLEEYDGRIKILRERKRGPAAARNKGVLNSTGEIIAFTDADCSVDKNWLKKIVKPLQDESIGIVGGKILSKRPCNKIEEFGENIHDHGKAINEFKPPYVITMNWASRRSVITEVGLFDESFTRCEDVDLSHKIMQANYRLVYEPDAIIYHSNEKTLSGLFIEGFRHGFWSIKGHKKWKNLISPFGHHRFNFSTYKDLLESLINYLTGQDRQHNICYFFFNLGKKFGKISGSFRFLYIDL